MHDAPEVYKADVLKNQIELGNNLVNSLADEYKRWTECIENNTTSLGNLAGDCTFLAGFIIYMGPLLLSFRNWLMARWKTYLNESEIPFSKDFNVGDFELEQSVIKEWNDKGLPVDKFSIENAVIIKKSIRWPLIIDPNVQAWRWLEEMESAFFLKIIEYEDDDVLDAIETAIALGVPVILRNVKENMDPALLPILKKVVVEKGNSLKFKLGKKLVDYNKNFRFYMVSRLKNPDFPPKLFMKTTVVNFSLNKSGLECQLLNVVVNTENPLLYSKKKVQIQQIVRGKKKINDFENDLLLDLSKCDEELFERSDLLKKFKKTTTKLKKAKNELSLVETKILETEKIIQEFTPCAIRATIILLILDDLLNIDPMYKFSFHDYVDFLEVCIRKSPKSEVVAERLDLINEYYTYAVYKKVCCMIFKKHQLIFSFLICTKIHSGQDVIKNGDINFLLKANDAGNLNLRNEPINPVKEWLPDEIWYNLCALVKNVSGFPDILYSFSENNAEWKSWYESEEPEKLTFIEAVKTLFSDFHCLLLIRAFRKDRLLHAIRHYVEKNIGRAYVEPYVRNLRNIFEESTPRTPLLFIKSSDSLDPSLQVIELAREMDMGNRVYVKNIGKGQEQVVKKIIAESQMFGFWIFISDCHNMMSWTPELEKIVRSLKANHNIHTKFRLWLSSMSRPDFPTTVLHSSIKIITEEPEGLKWQMKNIYEKFSEEQLNCFQKSNPYHQLLFALTFFHSQILERKKYFNRGCLGNYNFLITDFSDSQKILESVLQEYKDHIPWNILKNFIAERFYGGIVARGWEKSIITTYFDDLFNENVLNTKNYRMSPLLQYYIPVKGAPTFTKYLNNLPDEDHPEVLGLDLNNAIIINSKKAKEFCETLLPLVMDVFSEKTNKKEDIVSGRITEIIRKIPTPIEQKISETLVFIPLTIVLNKEIDIYNKLLATVRHHSNLILDGISGLLFMNEFLDGICTCIYENRIPKNWSKYYPTSMTLSSWIEDLVQRVDYMKNCVRSHLPLSEPHWLSAYICPSRVLMAVLQEASAQRGVLLYEMTWEFIPLAEAPVKVPSEGILVRGIFITGAGWDPKELVLVNAAPLQFYSPLSVMHFKPILKTEKVVHELNMYKCPLFYCNINKDEGICDEKWEFYIELNRGNQTCSHWIKRGVTAFLCHSG